MKQIKHYHFGVSQVSLPGAPGDLLLSSWSGDRNKAFLVCTPAILIFEKQSLQNMRIAKTRCTRTLGSSNKASTQRSARHFERKLGRFGVATEF